MAIKNQNSFTDVDFLPEDKFQAIGEYAGRKLLLIGRTKVYGEPIVAIDKTDESNPENLSACNLYELMQFGCHPVNLTASIN